MDIERLARLVVDYSLRLQPGEVVRLRGAQDTLPLLEAAYRIASEQGAHPFVDILHPTLDRLRLLHAPLESLAHISPIEQQKIERIDADLWVISAPEPTFADIAPNRLRRWQQAQGALTQQWADRTGQTERRLRWCAVLYPTAELAATAALPEAEFTALTARALKLDTPDPIAAWKAQSEHQHRIATYLVDCHHFRVTVGETDISFSTEGRSWFNANGRLNLPDGEVGTAPVEDSVNGTLHIRWPLTYMGTTISDIHLTFQAGMVVEAHATEGEEALHALLATDTGARRLGEFAIATNPALTQYTRCILLDEKMAGTCHFALGRSIPGTGGLNASSLHWDMVLDLREGGQVFADGHLIHANGAFVGPLAAKRSPRWAFWQRR